LKQVVVQQLFWVLPCSWLWALEGYCALYSWLWALPWALGVAPQSVVMMMMIFGRCVLMMMMMMMIFGVADEQSGTHPYTSDRV
jgi:hypothetical protein